MENFIDPQVLEKILNRFDHSDGLLNDLQENLKRTDERLTDSINGMGERLNKLESQVFDVKGAVLKIATQLDRMYLESVSRDARINERIASLETWRSSVQP